jgi:hypothetical protein
MKLLLDHRATAGDNHAIAARSDNAEAVQLLLDHRACPAARGNTPIYSAAVEGDAVAPLAGADIRISHFVKLRSYIRSGDLDHIQHLIEAHLNAIPDIVQVLIRQLRNSVI